MGPYAVAARWLDVKCWRMDYIQGRIQDLKLGVAQTDWKFENLKTGGGLLYLRYDYISLKCNILMYISNTI